MCLSVSVARHSHAHISACINLKIHIQLYFNTWKVLPCFLTHIYIFIPFVISAIMLKLAEATFHTDLSPCSSCAALKCLCFTAATRIIVRIRTAFSQKELFQTGTAFTFVSTFNFKSNLDIFWNDSHLSLIHI